MSYQKQPIWQFNGVAETGVDKMPISKVLQVVDQKKLYQKITSIGLTALTTIQEAITLGAIAEITGGGSGGGDVYLDKDNVFNGINTFMQPVMANVEGYSFKWKKPMTFNIQGAVSGTGSFDGSATTTITVSGAASNGDAAVTYYYLIPVKGQNTYDVPFGTGAFMVYLNGVALRENREYTKGTNQITLTGEIQSNDSLWVAVFTADTVTPDAYFVKRHLDEVISGGYVFQKAPKGITATKGTSDLTLATTEFVIQNSSGGSGDVLAAGDNTFTGNNSFTKPIISVTATKGTSDTQYATTEFVQQNSGGGGDTIPTGAIFPFAMNSAPAGFLVFDGSTVPSATYPKLYAAINTIWGGDATNFKLPDFRGMVLKGMPQSGRTFASLEQDGNQAHTHGITVASGDAQHSHIGGTTDQATAAHTHNGTISGGKHSHTFTTSGESQGHTHGGGSQGPSQNHTHNPSMFNDGTSSHSHTPTRVITHIAGEQTNQVMYIQ